MHVSYIIPILAAFISLSGALLSWHQARLALTLNTNNNVGEALLKLNQLFIDKPELWPYLVQAKKPIPKKYVAKAKVVAIMILNIFEAVWSQNKAMRKEDRTSWEGYINWQIRSVDIILDAYERNYEWYPNIRKIVKLDNVELNHRDKKFSGKAST